MAHAPSPSPSLRRLPLLALAALAPSCSGPAPVVAAPAAPTRSAARAEDRHLLFTLEVTPTGARILDVRSVSGPVPRAPAPLHAAWKAAAVGADGAVLHQVLVDAPTLVHGEFPRPDGTLERVDVSVADRAVLAVRLPIVAGASRLVLSSSPRAVPASPGWRELAAKGTAAGPPGEIVLGAVEYPAVLP